MIPKKWIINWRSFAPWATESQIEQDLVLSRIIVEIFSDPYLSASVAFRGGTALHKLFLNKPERYSEDIDLVMIHGGAIGQMMDAIGSRIDPWLGTPKRTRSESRVKMFYQFDTESQPIIQMRVKIEINAVENFSLLGLDHRHFSCENPWFSGEAKVTTYSIEELLGTKLRALYQRKKGRDLFDLYYCLQAFPEMSKQRIVESFLYYLSKEGNTVSRAEFEANLDKKIADTLFVHDLAALLSPDTQNSYDALIARDTLQENILSLLPGEPWRREQTIDKKIAN